MEVGTAESTENVLQASQAVADNDTGVALVVGNRLVKPHDIRERHHSRDCSSVSHRQQLMV